MVSTSESGWIRCRARSALASPALDEGYWRSVQDLFTRDVTGKSLRDLHSDARDTFRYFTRNVDLESLAGKPWYQRYPLATFRIFQAMAYRLSPARRLLFAVSVPLLWMGWLAYFFAHRRLSLLFTAMLAAATLLLALLILETPLERGDRLLLYTDGISEAENGGDEQYGEERLAAFLDARRAAPQAELIDGLIADVLAFCGSARPRDDMTLLLLSRSA